jgi:tRNA (guanine-N7-)-methyltransferase
LKPGGPIHLKTDSPSLFHFTRLITELYELDVQDASEDVYAREDNPPEVSIKTHYEKLDIAESKKVFYLRFILSEKKIPPPDTSLQELLKQIEKAETVK